MSSKLSTGLLAAGAVATLVVVGVLALLLTVPEAAEPEAAEHKAAKQPVSMAEVRVGKTSAERGGRPMLPGGVPSPANVFQQATASREEAAVLNHPWWQGQLTPSKLEKILDAVTGHGEGVVFIDKTGAAVWLSETALPIDSNWPDLLIHGRGENHAQAKGLKTPRILVRNRPPPLLLKMRYTRTEALQVLYDTLNRPDSEQSRREHFGVEDLKKIK